MLSDSAFVLFGFGGTCAEEAEAETGSHALAMFWWSRDKHRWQCNLMQAGLEVPPLGDKEAVPLAFQMDGRFFSLAENVQDAWTPLWCKHVQKSFALNVYLELLGKTWGPKLENTPHVAAGLRTRELVQGVMPAEETALFHDVLAWCDGLAMEDKQVGYYRRSPESMPERERRNVVPERRMTREERERTQTFTFPTTEIDSKSSRKRLHLDAFKYKPLQDGVG